MEDELEKLVEHLRTTPKAELKWSCPVCCGGSLERQKVTENNIGAELEITTELGELVVQVDTEGGRMSSKFPIRYCPWCGRKIREKLRKTPKSKK